LHIGVGIANAIGVNKLKLVAISHSIDAVMLTAGQVAPA
jgi:hypothetical protein